MKVRAKNPNKAYIAAKVAEANRKNRSLKPAINPPAYIMVDGVPHKMVDGCLKPMVSVEKFLVKNSK